MKIFGTGWQRTGTTSLARALSELGIRTRDYPKDLLHDIDHEVIRQYEAFTDNPIPLLYRELDALHPGSKFIHTVRGEEDWLSSVEWLFTQGRIKFEWDKRPVIDEIHDRLYGRTDFDAHVFLERYRRHNREVREYFADRPGDFLEVDITRGDGFEKLCPFLGLPLPSIAFPHSNQSEGALKIRLRNFLHRLRR